MTVNSRSIYATHCLYLQGILADLRRWGKVNQEESSLIACVGAIGNVCDRSAPDGNRGKCQLVGASDGRKGGGPVGF